VASIQVSAISDSKVPDGSRCPGCQKRDAAIRELQELVGSQRRRIRYLEKQLGQLRERNGRNSSNSSMPPSSNPPDARRPKTDKKPSGRKRGAQPGHPPTNPPLLPPERLSAPPTVCVPTTCAHCQAPLSGKDDCPDFHQVLELPPLLPDIREWQLHRLTCRHCGHTTSASLPEGVPANTFGPRLEAFIGLCTGAYHLSKRQAEELLSTAFNIPISLGSICNIEQRVSAAIAEPVAEAKREVQQAKVANADETSWPQQPHKAWLWAAVTTHLAVFGIYHHRDRASAEDLLGAKFAGVLGTDRYSSYDWVKRRQLCWAHLRRDWQAFIDRRGTSRRLGERLLQQTDKMFRMWHRVRDGTMPRWLFYFHMIDVRKEVGTLLREGIHCAHSRTAGTCADILAKEDALWTFVSLKGVEPTNNAAERILRQAVLWRKKSFGTRGPLGSQYAERLLTVVATCRLQGRNVLEYLTAACQAAVRQTSPPSLLRQSASGP
jgi:transposase